jgi:hypothetical protein
MRQILILSFVLLSGLAWAQRKTPVLERTITITLTNERLDVALKKIAVKGGFTFSYKSSIVDESKVVSYAFTGKTVKQILDELFRGNIQYRERGRYIILTRKALEKGADIEGTKVKGYVIDEATGERLRNVSVYDPISLSSVITDKDGYFELDIKKPTSEEIKLAINKRDYADTLIVVPSKEERLVNIPLRINKEKITTVVDSVGNKLKRVWMATKKATIQAVNMENIQDTIHRRFQFCFVPFVGTNGALSGNVVNEFSFNMLGGYSLGVNKAEFGGLFNTVRGDLKGAQFAGWFNGVMSKNKGLQFAGLANAVIDSSTGPQFAGLANVNFSHTRSFQMAGLGNYTQGDSRGTKFAGLMNFSLGVQQGPHFAGLFNFAVRDAGPVQVAGLFNFTAGNMHGVQVGGLFNYSNEQFRGAQIAGLFNVSPKYAQGLQLAPLNFAKHVTGAQIGVLNVSKSIRGIPIGLMSIVGTGYHKIEISADEIFYTNVAFRTGVRKFYNIITAGASPSTFQKDTTLWSFGYGIGTAPKISEWLDLNFDLTAHQIVNGNKIDNLNLINKLFVGVDFRLAKGLSVTTGITLNAHVKDKDAAVSDITADYRPAIFYEREIGSKRDIAMWWGGKIGLRFL